MEKSAIVCVPKYHRLGEGFSKREKIEALVHPGRRTTPRGYQSAVSWISDLITLRKYILLCSFCSFKFDPRQFGYRKSYVLDLSGMTSGYQVMGQCDSCKGRTGDLGGGTGYIAEETYHLLNVDPSVQRRKRRAAVGYKSIWSAVKREQQKRK